MPEHRSEPGAHEAASGVRDRTLADSVAVRLPFKPMARRILGDRYREVGELLSQHRLHELEFRVSELEQRHRKDLAPQLASVLYQGDQPPRPLAHHELQIHSQNGEDGIILYLLSRTGTSSRRLAEIGIGDGSECNSANLLINWGWSGVLIEGSETGAASASALHRNRLEVSVINAFVTAENANDLLGNQTIDLLSIDIDGNDYWVWRSIESLPRVMIVEYNASLGPTRSVTIPYKPTFDYTTASDHRLYHGASLAALAKLGRERGMALVGCDSRGVNAFFVQREFLSPALPELSAEEAWRPIRKRLRRWPQDVQEELLARFEFVEV